MSKVSAKRQRSSEVGGGPILDEVHPVWLEVSPGERCASCLDAGSDLVAPFAQGQVLHLACFPGSIS